MSRNILSSEIALAPQAQQLPNLMKDDKYGGAGEIMSLPSGKLVAILRDPGASVYVKAKACQRLAVVGDRSAVPALAPLLVDPQLSHYARTVLETSSDASADDVLRAALSKAQGNLLVGVINSIGQRRDSKAIGALEKLRHDPDMEVARAADAALGRVRPPL